MREGRREGWREKMINERERENGKIVVCGRETTHVNC